MLSCVLHSVTGVVAGLKYDEESNGGNYLCLTDHPEFAEINRGTQSSRGRIWGATFVMDKNDPDKDRSFHWRPVSCAKCRLKGATNYIKLAGKRTCPPGYRTEYEGYLVSTNQDEGREREKRMAPGEHATTEYICVDKKPDRNQRSPPGLPGAFLARVEARCQDTNGEGAGSLPCNIYPEGNELTCVICSQ